MMDIGTGQSRSKPMKKTHNRLTCLFEHHQYSEKLTEDKHGRPVFLCKHCKRAAYRDTPSGYRRWYKYDENGICIYVKFSNGDVLVVGADGFWNGEQ